MPVHFENTTKVAKVIPIDGIDEVRRLYFGGVLLSALILEKFTFFSKSCFFNIFFLKFCASYSKSWPLSNQVDSLLGVFVILDW